MRSRIDAGAGARQPLAARIASGFPRPRRARRILGNVVLTVIS
jgi:hypothetical protein